jgi:dipeptidyl aminopeptidase/acylaminoacyl peptidase
MAELAGFTTRRPIALGDLTRLRAVSDPRISSDGRRIAFVVETIVLETNQTRSQIWLADDGAEPRPLTSGEHRDSQPSWSPDGNNLAFVSNRSGSDQIWLLPLSGGEPRPLTSHPVGAHEPVWSPDSRRVAFLGKGADRRGDPLVPDSTDDRARLVWVREHRHKLDGAGFTGSHRTHLWTIPIAGGPAEQLTDGPFDDADPAWSPDGKEIAFVSDRSNDRDWHFGGGAIHLVAVASGQIRRLTTETEGAAHPSWSPDGKHVAYVAAAGLGEASSENFRLWIRSADGSDARCLTADLDRSVGQRPGGYLTPSPAAWTADGSALLYPIGDGPSTHLCRVADQDRVALTGGRGAVLSFSADRSGTRAAFLATDPVTPPEVWVWDATAGMRVVSAINREVLDQLALATPIDLKLSRPDGTSVDAWLLAPPTPSEGAIPLILSVHGGPHNYFGDTFSFDHQLFAALGYAVLYGNPRGSGGYGEKFAGAVCEDWGGEDFCDQMALVDLAIARADPPIDPNRLAITGGSYGGFMTCWAITQTDRFAVGVSGACISNLASFFGTSDVGASWGAREFGGAPWERPVWYHEHSPVTHAPKVKTPLLLYHGEADLRCPIEQSEQMFTALLRLGKTVEFFRVPGESHGVLNGAPVHRIAAREAILAWFARYLGK